MRALSAAAAAWSPCPTGPSPVAAAAGTKGDSPGDGLALAGEDVEARAAVSSDRLGLAESPLPRRWATAATAPIATFNRFEVLHDCSLTEETTSLAPPGREDVEPGARAVCVAARRGAPVTDARTHGGRATPCLARGASAPAPAQAAAVAPSLMARLAGLQRLHQGPGRGRRHSSQPALPSSALGSARAKTATSRLHQGSGWRRRPPWPAPPSSAPGSARKPAGSLHQGSGWRRRSQVVTAPPSSAPGLASSAAAAARRRKTCTKEAAVHPLRRRAASTLTTMPRGSKLNLRAPCLARSEEAGARLKSLPRTGHRHLRPCPARSPHPWAHLLCPSAAALSASAAAAALAKECGAPFVGGFLPPTPQCILPEATLPTRPAPVDLEAARRARLQQLAQVGCLDLLLKELLDLPPDG